MKTAKTITEFQQRILDIINHDCQYNASIEVQNGNTFLSIKVKDYLYPVKLHWEPIVVLYNEHEQTDFCKEIESIVTNDLILTTQKYLVWNDWEKAKQNIVMRFELFKDIQTNDKVYIPWLSGVITFSLIIKKYDTEVILSPISEEMCNEKNITVMDLLELAQSNVDINKFYASFLIKSQNEELSIVDFKPISEFFNHTIKDNTNNEEQQNIDHIFKNVIVVAGNEQFGDSILMNKKALDCIGNSLGNYYVILINKQDVYVVPDFVGKDVVKFIAQAMQQAIGTEPTALFYYSAEHGLVAFNM